VAGVGGYAAWRSLAGEDDGDAAPPDGNSDPEGLRAAGRTRQRIVEDEPNVGDAPLDEFDQPAREVAAFTGTPQGRVTNAVFRAAVNEPSAVRPPPPPPAPTRTPVEQHVPSSPASITGEDPEIESVRTQLAERLEGFQPPEGSDPEDAAKLEADLEGLLERYQPYPGQSVEDAVATLRYEFEDRVRDFAQDQRIEAVIAEQERQILEAEELETRVDEFKEQLSERLDSWQPPEGADPEEAAELKAELEAMLDRYVAVPGQSPEDALAELRYRFNDEVGDFAQDLRIDALVEEQRDAEEDGDEAVSDDVTDDDDGEVVSDGAIDEDGGEVVSDDGGDDATEATDSIEESLAGMELEVAVELERIRENFDRETLVARPPEEMARLATERADAESRLEEIRQARTSTDQVTREALVDRHEVSRSDAEDVSGTGVVADTVMVDPVPDDAAPVVLDVFDEIVDDDMTVMTAPGGRTSETSVDADVAAVDGGDVVSGDEPRADTSAQDDLSDVDDVMGTAGLEDTVVADEGSTSGDEVPVDVETADTGVLQDDLVSESDDLLGVASEKIPDVDADVAVEDVSDVDVLSEEIPDVESDVAVEDVSDVDVLTEEIPDVESYVPADDGVMDLLDDPMDAFDATTEADDATDDV
jgi:hypothetical protein